MILVDKIPALFGKEMQESGFAAARWASAWVCHLAEVKGGRNPFWVKRQKWPLWKSFWRCNMGSSNLLWAKSYCVRRAGPRTSRRIGVSLVPYT